MLINLFGELYGPVVVASFSGAMLFTLIQRTFQGKDKFLIFIISLFMGVTGADTTASLLSHYLPPAVHVGREVGAFVCSSLIVTASMAGISYIERRRQGDSRS